MLHFFDQTLPTLAENLALDEAFLLDAEAGGPEVLRIWNWQNHAVVLGAAGKLADDVDEEACRSDGVPIARRSSGGGTVLLGKGCLVFSLILRFERDPALADLHASYRFILGRIVESLGASASLQGLSDMTMEGRKFSGNSQQRKRTHLLHHGTLLYAFDAQPMRRYLKNPPRQPEYRQKREHVEFLTNVPSDEGGLRNGIRNVWHADQVLTTWPVELVEQLVAEKYAREGWIRRR